MPYGEYESSSSEDESSSSWLDFTPTKANESNPFFLEDYASLLSSVKKHIAETKESSLEMEDYGIGAAEVKSILGALTNSDSQITNLLLQGSNFKNGTGGVFRMLADTKLDELNISSSKLSSADLMRLMEVLKDTLITDLNVAMNDIKLDENDASRFTSHLLESRLTHLDFGANQFEPATGALSFIQALPRTSITCLNLGECSLHNDVLISLFSSIHLTSITELDVSLNEITDVHLKELSGNLKASKLEILDLSCNNIQDAGMDFLAAGLVDSSIVELNVGANNFSGKNSFCSCLKNTKIQKLDFSGNVISHDKMFSFPRFLKGSSVESLDIDYCELGDKVGQKLIRSLKFSELKDFYAAGNQFGALSLLEFVKVVNSTKLKDVSFAENALPYPEFVIFVQCLERTQLHYVSMAANFTYPSSLLAVPLLLCSAEGSPITVMDVGVSEISQLGIRAIADILAEIKITNLMLYSNNPRGGLVKFARHLKFSSLTHLNLHDNKIKDAGAEALAKCLKETQIIDLDISANLITSYGAAALAEGLKGSSLLELNLRSNKIENEGYIALAEGVKDTFITCLDVSHNPGTRILLVEKVLWENRTSEAHLVNFFKRIAPENAGGLFCFDPPENTNFDTFVNDILNFCKTLLEQPAAVCALGEEETIPFSKTEILNLMSEEFSKQFSTFIARRIDGSVSGQIRFLKKAEELGFNIVQSRTMKETKKKQSSNQKSIKKSGRKQKQTTKKEE